MTFEQFWRENEQELASRHYRDGKWNVYSLIREVYERKQDDPDDHERKDLD